MALRFSAENVGRKSDLQPTASRAELLLNCSYPFDPSLIPNGEGDYDRTAANYGIKIHAELAVLLKDGIEAHCDPAPFSDHAKAAYSKLKEWLKTNGWKDDCDRYIEVSLAYGPAFDTGRLCSPPDVENHLYADLEADEIGGTADLVVVPKDPSRPLLVLDHKTGMWGDFSHPGRLVQLQVLGLAASAYWKRESFIPAVLHTPRDGIPIVYEDEAAHSIGHPVRTLLIEQLSRIGDGYMRPGSHCRRCPVRNQCPTQNAELLGKAGELVEKATLVGSELVLVGNSTSLSQEERIGRLHLLMSRFRQLDDAAVREMKRLMKEEPSLEPIRPDGKTLTLRTRHVERINKEKLLAAYGEEALRSAGILEDKEEVILWAK